MLPNETQPTFAEKIDTLDKTIEHAWHVSLPEKAGGGRAYLHGINQYYGGPIFFANRGEEHYGRLKGFETSKQYKGGLYMGAAGIVNLSYIAAMRNEAAILFDINPYQKIFWNTFIRLLAEHEDKEEFVKAFEGEQEAIANTVHFAAHGESIQQRFNDTTAWQQLSQTTQAMYHCWMPIVSPFERKPPAELIWYENDHHYAHLHQLAKNGKIGALTLDVCDTKSIASLAEILSGQRLSTLYFSNIFTFIERSSDWTGRDFGRQPPNVKQAKSALSQLLSHDSLLISHNRIETNFWSQKMFHNFASGSYGNGRVSVDIP